MINNRFPFAHTFSIIARDPITGDMGAAVQSHWFSTGSIVIWGEAGVGVVATQSMVEMSYGPLGLEGIRKGEPVDQVLNSLLARDDGRDLRQIAMLDHRSRVATHTGARCIAAAGHFTGSGFSVQANMMANENVWPAMAKAYLSAEGPLAERLMNALFAAQEAGGDIRGQQSAAILVVKGESTGKPWEGRLIDLRVEDHPTPLLELHRLLKVHGAYRMMNLGDELLGKGQVADAMQAYRSAAMLLPDQEELPFWEAVTLADLGRYEEALILFRSVFKRNPSWKELLRRLPAAGLIKNENGQVDRILSDVSIHHQKD